MHRDQKRDVGLLEGACESLGEYFDSVQIIASRHEPEMEDGTVIVSSGVGNYFARCGSVREWLIRSDRRTEIEAEEDQSS